MATVIPGCVPTDDSDFIVLPQANGTLTNHQSHYPEIELPSQSLPYPVMLIAMLRIDKYEFCKLSVWLSWIGTLEACTIFRTN